MNWIEKMTQYLFYFMQTVQNEIDINKEMDILSSYIDEFERLNFEHWVKDNELEEEYENYKKGSIL